MVPGVGEDSVVGQRGPPEVVGDLKKRDGVGPTETSWVTLGEGEDELRDDAEGCQESPCRFKEGYQVFRLVLDGERTKSRGRREVE